MHLNKLIVKNFKILKNLNINLNKRLNIFVGQNDSGKSTILEALSILMTGRVNGQSIDRALNVSIFNKDVRKQFIETINRKEKPELPAILFEGYFTEESGAFYKGTNNSCSEDSSGISLTIEFNEDYSELYKKMLLAGEIKDIPVEFYKITFKSFKGETLSFKQSPFSVNFVDTSKKDYSTLVSKFIDINICEYVEKDIQLEMQLNYKKANEIFKTQSPISSMNEQLLKNQFVKDKNIHFDIKDGDIDEWKKSISMFVDDMSYDYLGFGTQNIMKIELSILNRNRCDILLFEEPENNLSYTNMNKMIGDVESNVDSQLFVSTHSSFVCNKLGIDNIFLVHNGNVSKFTSVSAETISFFKKIPNFDTLRVILGEKIILVEGPTDKLLIEKCYLSKKGKLPIQNCIDIIVLNNLSFKRYCELAKCIGKRIAIVTDNDGDIEINIKEKYKDYIGDTDFSFFYESDPNLRTIEPSVLEVNTKTDEDFKVFKEVISPSGHLASSTKKEILAFMTANKTEWGLRVFESDKEIKYPEYVVNVVDKYC